MAITGHTFFPVAPDYSEINARALAPKNDSPLAPAGMAGSA
jgi:hypothetical protein